MTVIKQRFTWPVLCPVLSKRSIAIRAFLSYNSTGRWWCFCPCLADENTGACRGDLTQTGDYSCLGGWAGIWTQAVSEYLVPLILMLCCRPAFEPSRKLLLSRPQKWWLGANLSGGRMQRSLFRKPFISRRHAIWDDLSRNNNGNDNSSAAFSLA